jgi:formylglycine-generating enzyme required for sulfatase activity
MRWIGTLLAFLVLAALPASAQGPRRVALVVANATYAHASRLANPLNDARLVADGLRRAGFQTVDLRTDVPIATFRTALRDFRAKADGAQVALVYYAGHGIEAAGRNWLIPVDAMLAADRDLQDEAIDLDRVLDDVSGAQLRVVVLDSCRDNPFGRTWRRGTRAVTRGLGPVDVDDVLVIYAAAPGQTASDGEGRANSPFAAALAKRLPQADLPIQLLGGTVRDDVLAATGGVQRPFVSASITGTPFYLVPRTPTPPATQTSAPPPGSPQSPATNPNVARRAGESFTDCRGCPTLVVLGAGSFRMGDDAGDPDERPAHQVSFARPYAIMKYETTFNDWDACVAERACPRARDSGWGRNNYPVINVSHADAQAYAAWLSRRTGARYRLPTEAEWEFAARAGESAHYVFGASITTAQANYAKVRNRTAQVGSYGANRIGLHDVHGNVAEWTLDCWGADYTGAPREGSTLPPAGACAQRSVRGGSWNISEPGRIRFGNRAGAPPDTRDDTIGFRLVREM